MYRMNRLSIGIITAPSEMDEIICQCAIVDECKQNKTQSVAYMPSPSNVDEFFEDSRRVKIMLIIILAAVLCSVLCVVDQQYAMNFQERYNIPATGELDENIIQLLNRPRCNVSEAASDDDHSFRVKSKWSKFDLKWYFPQATTEYLKVTKKAFEVWIVRGKHYFRVNCQGRGECSSTFDGPGKVLAHAYFPKGNSCIELHIDADDKWVLSLDGSSSEDQTSLLMVLIHEIGHILGIAHSDIETAIMYP
ncbi:matrix metalloproteinase-2-like [Diorhabda sublineata]|uniref:matrix metalloproteinase-2-like n=1 Tax=Diorhabda sublineata TaxID=1163346 RepID=UPI0024E116FC|nr:matrix metalloproteinase-2-like [Diorhabda sublineata]